MFYKFLRKITKYKYFCIGMSKYDIVFPKKRFFKIDAIFGTKCDHEGLMINIDIGTFYNFWLELCDSRHWDDEKNDYIDPEKFDC